MKRERQRNRGREREKEIDGGRERERELELGTKTERKRWIMKGFVLQVRNFYLFSFHPTATVLPRSLATHPPSASLTLIIKGWTG